MSDLTCVPFVGEDRRVQTDVFSGDRRWTGLHVSMVTRNPGPPFLPDQRWTEVSNPGGPRRGRGPGREVSGQVLRGGG